MERPTWILRVAAVVAFGGAPFLLSIPPRATTAALEAETEEAKQRLSVARADDLDPGLPEGDFLAWLLRVLPPRTELAFEINDCGEQTGVPGIDAARVMPRCLAVEADVVSRARGVELLFDAASLHFRGGAVFSDELEGSIAVRRLSDLEPALKRGLRPFPLGCPDGTLSKLREEHAGLREWCEDRLGRKQGPYRSWFSTGLYLMQRGRYADGVKTGEWVECSRFERCERVVY